MITVSQDEIKQLVQRKIQEALVKRQSNRGQPLRTQSEPTYTKVDIEATELLDKYRKIIDHIIDESLETQKALHELLKQRSQTFEQVEQKFREGLAAILAFEGAEAALRKQPLFRKLVEHAKNDDLK